ncbi:MAG TPA: histidine kinase [Rariglobus sp.]
MLPPASFRTRLFWTLQIGGWLTLVPVYIGINLMAGFSRELAFLNGFSRQVIGLLLTLVLWRIYRRWSFARGSVLRYGALAAALSLAATAVDFAIFKLVYATAYLSLDETLTFPMLFGATMVRLGIYAGWSLLYLSVHQFLDARDQSLRIARAEVAMRDAELLVLRAQLNPHFLFNALNSIVAEADDNPAGVKTITRGLSDFLRFSLHQRDHFGRLGEELAAIENYLSVERSRFEERLNWRIEVPPALRTARVPCALLLPLVENAIKFGLQTSPAALELRVGAERRDGVLAAFVENSGRWIEPDPDSVRSTHIGLANLRRRLELLCGAQARVDISFPPGRVRVQVSVPLEETAA